MIDLYWVVQVNNFLCILACVCCFLHALHGGIYTNNIAKLVLFLLGLGFFSSTIYDQVDCNANFFGNKFVL